MKNISKYVTFVLLLEIAIKVEITHVSTFSH